jgi:hypothetical protein
MKDPYATIELNSDDQYDINFQRFLNSHHPDLLVRPELIEQLEFAQGREILSEFIELACQCQNIRNIELGRAGIWMLPKKWVLECIEEVVELMLYQGDEWEYLRLIEVYWHIDKSLVNRLAMRCLDCCDSEIQELGKDCLAKLNNPIRDKAIEYWEL